MTVIVLKLKSWFNMLSGLGISWAPGLNLCSTRASKMALFSSQTIELIELLAIHAVCSLDSKDTMNGRGRGRLSRRLRVTVGPASRIWPLPRVEGSFTFCRAVCFPAPLFVVGHFGVVFWGYPSLEGSRIPEDAKMISQRLFLHIF